MSYIVIIEHAAEGFSAYVPDLPGCVAAAKTRERVEQLIADGIPFHIEGLRRNGEPVPRATSEATRVEVLVA